MRYQEFVAGAAAAALSIGVPAPARAQSAWGKEATQSAALKWELSYLALSAIDTAQTISCLDKGICSEANPLFGKHPSTGKLIAAKVALSAVHFAIFNHVNGHNPKGALRFAQISAGVQGSVVLLNARFTFN